ncbi:hypothetical protein [Flavobacterium sp.]|uniref:hypothetical protein n=1 Tax=Flavobacterium sp. TaxID=239 RepID=UPI002C954F45|nr:hypothetical protein [Flavobacterium sp.]HSD08655.1 hypothetical protein [Flavobacterium sp.]
MKLNITLKNTDCNFIFPNLQYKSSTFKSFGKTIYFALILFIITFSSFGQSNNCSAKLIVEDDGYVDSAAASGVLYNMIITNNGSSTDTYTLSSVNVNSTSKNPDDSETNNNVLLNTAFLDSQKNVITEITVNPGESVTFYSKLTIPVGTVLAKWSNNKIIATSTKCNSYKVEIILHTYVLKPNND